MASHPDFEAEGLLDGLAGDERADRLALLERLVADGVGIDELRAAVAEDRLAFVAVERALAGEPRYTPREVAERAGIEIGELERQWRSIGIAIPRRDLVCLSREDLEAAHRQRALLDAGLDPDSLAELGRTIAVSMSQFAAASRQALAAAFFDPAEGEAETSDRIAHRTESLMPLVAPTLEYVYRLQLREQLRHAAVLGVAAGPGAELVTVAFADLVGYTELGEDVPPEELGRITGRLDEVARDVAHGPVRLVKLIGDAAMLSCADTPTLLEAVLEVVAEMAAEGEYPLIRAGVARGRVVNRAGDYYGAPVNLASRITGVARPGTVLTSTEVREAAEADGDRFSFSKPIRRHLKGIGGAVDLHRCRAAGESDENDPGAGEASMEPREPRRRRARRS